MKAILLWEPWASLMMLGAKKIETRGWATKYRGPLLICAAQGGLGIIALRCLVRNEPFKSALRPLIKEQFARDLSIVDFNHGKALCIVDLIDCIPTECLLARSSLPDATELAFGDYTSGRSALITTNLRPFEKPFEIKGGQRIFNVPDEVIEGKELRIL